MEKECLKGPVRIPENIVSVKYTVGMPFHTKRPVHRITEYELHKEPYVQTYKWYSHADKLSAVSKIIT